MLLKIVYLLTRRVLGLAVLVFRGDLAKDAELLVLRHENAVLRRHAGRVRYEPGDRVWLAALALYGPVFCDPNHVSRRFRCQDSPYRAASAASPPACAGVTHSTANGRSSMSAIPGSSSPAAVCSAGSSSSGPGAFQNGATDSAADRALTRSPASSRALTSVSAHDGDASARAAKACCPGHTTTAARRYQRSIVLPKFPMYPVWPGPAGR